MQIFSKLGSADIKSGFTVFLIALPLSIGISLASGAPATAGLLAAIVGGLVGSWMGGSRLTINGPAAGMITVCFGAVEALGQGNSALGFKYALAAFVAAGVIQIALGALRLATIGLAFPSAAIHGMLSAIGAIILIKQFPVLLGVKPVAKSVFGIIAEAPSIFAHLNPEITAIGVVSLLILFGAPRLPFKFVKKLPMPLVAVTVGLVMGLIFDIQDHHTVDFLGWKFEVDDKFLLSVPGSLSDALIRPDWGMFFTLLNLKAVFSICLVGSIESVLSTFAVDKLDPLKRTSDLNRDLLSKGICNTMLGMIGGLPIISEIVRSSANIDAGAKSRVSNFLHGGFILVFVAAFPAILHEIPLASLGAILIFVGYRLSHPSQFRHAAHVGPDHILVFLATFVTTLATDLLVGIAVGVLVEAAIAFVNGVRVKQFLTMKYDEKETRGAVKLTLHSPAVFTNWLRLRKILNQRLAEKKSVSLSFSDSVYVDHTVIEQIDRFRELYAAAGAKLELDYETTQPISSHPLASRRKSA